MKQLIRLLALALVIYSGDATSAGDRLPGTFAFQNATFTHIDAITESQTPGEKEVEFGDFDDDGDLDVVVANAFAAFGSRVNKLYRNDGGQLVEISGAHAIPGFATPDVSRNAFFRDYDGDGWLDIGIINDANSGGDSGRSKIYINKQIDGAFDHFEEEGELRLPSGGAACGGFSYDFDLDGDEDLYFGNYPGSSQDRMYFNDGAGYFTEVTTDLVPNDTDYTVDVSGGDLNGDGKLDLFVTSLIARFAYFNDNDEGGEQIGDYKYADSVTPIDGSTAGQNAIEPGDFDNDGRLDAYWTNANSFADRVLRNMGNDPSGKAIFDAINSLPDSVVLRSCNKPTVVDINRDGRLDVFVAKGDFLNARPTILRNTTYDDNISFVDWTQGNRFADGPLYSGWHAAAFDVDGDGFDDLLFGGATREYLFLNIPAAETTEADANAALTASFAEDPVAFRGFISSETDSFTGPELPQSNHSSNPIPYISIILNSCGDTTLAVRNADSEIIATSNRGGLGVEEVVTIFGPIEEYTIQVTLNQACGDSDADQDVDLIDWLGFLGCVEQSGAGSESASADPRPASICDALDLDQSGAVDLLDYAHFQRRFTGDSPTAAETYIFEALSR